MSTHHKEFEDLLAQALELAEYYKTANTFQSEHHGDLLMPEGKMASEFIERWQDGP